MSLKYGSIELEGPLATLEELNDAPGVYTILCLNEQTGNVELLLVKTAALVQSEVAIALLQSWSDVCKGKLRVAVFYGDEGPELEEVRKQILLANA